MKLRSILFVSLFALTLPIFGGPAKPEDEKAVLAAEKQYVDGLIKADAAALDKILGDDLAYTHSSSLTESKADVLKVVKAGTLHYKSIEIKSTKVRQYGNMVVTNHNMVFTMEQPSAVNNLYVTMVWAKTPAGWQLVQRQATRLPQ